MYIRQLKIIGCSALLTAAIEFGAYKLVMSNFDNHEEAKIKTNPKETVVFVNDRLIHDSGEITYDVVRDRIKVIAVQSEDGSVRVHLAFLTKHIDESKNAYHIEYFDMKTKETIKDTVYDLYQVDSNGEIILDKKGRAIHNSELIKSKNQPETDKNIILSETDLIYYLTEENSIKNAYSSSELIDFYNKNVIGDNNKELIK